MNLNNWKKQSKETWLSQVRIDNPSMDDSVYFRKIDDDIQADAFAFYTDLKEQGSIPALNDSAFQSKTGIYISNSNAELLKSTLTSALENGCEYIHFQFPESFSENDLHQLLENVYLDMLITRWSFSNESLLRNCNALIKNKFPGAKYFFTKNNSIPLLSNDLLNSNNYSFGPFELSAWVIELNKIIHEANESDNISKSFIVELNLNHDFLLNICSIRALKLILHKIWNIYNLKSPVYLEASIDSSVLSTDLHANIYKCASIALSATLSGVDFIIIPPADIYSGNHDLNWVRTALHTQHILQQESYLHSPADPAAGSYYIEELTEQIAERTWAKLQEDIQDD